MKKLFTFILATILLIFSTACGQNTSSISQDEVAQSAYDCIEAAELLCKTGMEIISTAWHFGIWDTPECNTANILDKLAVQIGFEAAYIEQNGGYSVGQLVNGDNDFPAWEYCLWTAENCLIAADVYTSLEEALETAQTLLKSLTEKYEHHQDLKDYYTKVAVYAEYFKKVTGSYNDMTAAVLKYEEDIQKAKEPLLFDFG